ncbi:hypothetical protein A8C56_17915 [Niabella ginsenosidivorans]|uniref:Exosortase K n=1 Tax=Niabella ginsenosidivorans TaxID=1176587 RepID=A0A1A9I7B9_9BACT|nr:hypothetical protein A8C56_17915 [Niabella ginsenosidivorans]
MLTALLLMKYCSNEAVFLKRLPAGIAFSFLFTLLVNSSRILTALWIKKIGFQISLMNADTQHELLGAFIYLAYLTAAYLWGDSYLNKKNHENIS